MPATLALDEGRQLDGRTAEVVAELGNAGGYRGVPVRAHWAIENSLHWVLDVAFDEDRARNRTDNGPENLAILRRITLNLMRKALPRLPVARKRKRAAWSDAIARSIIGHMR